jgi:hypothetical protein
LKFVVGHKVTKTQRKIRRRLPKFLRQAQDKLFGIEGVEKEFRIWVSCSWPEEHHYGMTNKVKNEL